MYLQEWNGKKCTSLIVMGIVSTCRCILMCITNSKYLLQNISAVFDINISDPSSLYDLVLNEETQDCITTIMKNFSDGELL